MREYDDAVLECFLDKQLQLFPEAVAETLDEAEDFLEECMKDPREQITVPGGLFVMMQL